MIWGLVLLMKENKGGESQKPWTILRLKLEDEGPKCGLMSKRSDSEFKGYQDVLTLRLLYG